MKKLFKKNLVLMAVMLLFTANAWGGSAINYTSNTSPVETDQFLGIDDPSGTWTIQRFPISNVWTSILKSYADALYQPDSSVLDKYAGVDPSANVLTLLGNASYADFLTDLFSGGYTFGAVAFDLSSATVTLPSSQALTTPNIGAATGTSLDISGAAGLVLQNDETITNAVNGVVKVTGILETTGNIELGHATENTLSASGGVLSIEGDALLEDVANSVDYANTIGSYKAQTPLTGDADDFDDNFTGAYLYGGTYVCNATGTCILPALTAGMNFSIITLGAIAVIVDTNANDGYLHNGVTGAEGANITNKSTAGDIAVVQYYTADDWLITSNAWTAE